MALDLPPATAELLLARTEGWPAALQLAALSLREAPDTEFSVQQSAASRTMIEEYLKRTKTAIWIEHDFVANAKLKKAPGFYD